jgi:alginate O-acetyltransferase complex protein AlgI
MIFTSYTYVAFLLAAFLVHWSLPERARKPFLLVASYVFYGSWDARYTLLLFGVSLFNWAYGRFVVARTGSSSSRALAAGVLVNLIPLLYFKYTGFLVTNVASIAHLLGFAGAPAVPSIVLPLGISFFTFQGIAYLVDVAAGEEPFDKPLDFLLYKAFWPQLIAGPIVRPGEIREAIVNPRAVAHDDLAHGGQRILLGFFKKAVLADSVGPVVDLVFAPGAQPHFLDAVVGIVGFGVQIYMDFSAYSDIAIGSARLFGFVFPENFDNPYLARSPQEFWNRWHMTLSRWIRDYVFTPLNFAARRRPWMSHVFLVLAMAGCGLWHGAQWTFVLWGVWHGVLLVLGQTALRGVFARPAGGAGARSETRARKLVPWALTMALVLLGWVLFRAPSPGQALDVYRALFTFRGGVRPALVRENGALVVAASALVVMAAPFAAGALRRLEERLGRGALAPRLARAAAYCVLVTLAIVFDSDAKAFVYFQF